MQGRGWRTQWRRYLSGSAPSCLKSSSCLARPAISPQEAAARPVSPGERRLHLRLPRSSASRLTTSTRRLPRARPRGRVRALCPSAAKEDAWPAFAAMPRLRAARGRRRRAQGRPSTRRRSRLRRREPAPALSERAAERGAVGGAHARRGRPRRALAHHHGKAVRHRSRERGGAQRQAARGVRRGADLPHRPFPRQGAGAEHPRVPLRQRPVRADLEPQFHRSRADRRAGDARPRQARRRSTSRPAPFATWW